MAETLRNSLDPEIASQRNNFSMSFKTHFRTFSYATIAVATLTLMLAGGLSVSLAVLLWLVMVASAEA